jgi:coenzyme PQQ precursor peptide PqqA
MSRALRRWPEVGAVMTWKTPKIIEIGLGAEINCYACAELTA